MGKLPDLSEPLFPIFKMDTIITFFVVYTKRIYAVFLKSTIHDAELLIPL